MVYAHSDLHGRHTRPKLDGVEIVTHLVCVVAYVIGVTLTQLPSLVVASPALHSTVVQKGTGMVSP